LTLIADNKVQRLTTAEVNIRHPNGTDLFKLLCIVYYPSFRDDVLQNVTTVEEWGSTAKIQSKIREHIAKAHRMWKQQYDTWHVKPINYDVGELLFIRKKPDATLSFYFNAPFIYGSEADNC